MLAVDAPPEDWPSCPHGLYCPVAGVWLEDVPVEEVEEGDVLAGGLLAADSGWLAGWGIEPELAPADSPLFTFFDREAHPKTKRLKHNETRKIFFIPCAGE